MMLAEKPYGIASNLLLASASPIDRGRCLQWPHARTGKVMISTTNLLGAFAAIASTVSFTPQAWRIIRTGETHAISTGMYVITVCGFALWTAYGIRLAQWPLMASNTVCLLLSGFILAMKLLPGRGKKAVIEKVEKVIGPPET
jgi:MtN3 and saliva related transmembrane protein